MRPCSARRSASSCASVRHFMGQRVLEHVDHFRPHACVVNQLGGSQRPQAIFEGRRRTGDDALEHAPRKLPADDGGHSKHVSRGRIEPPQPAEQHIPNGVGNVDLSDWMDETRFVSTELHETAFLQRPQDLLHEERVAFRFPVDDLLKLRRERRCPEDRAADFTALGPRDLGERQPCAEGLRRERQSRTRSGESRTTESGWTRCFRPSGR